MNITVLSSNEQILAELGARVRRARIDVPLTQAELAKRAGVSLSTVASLERGGDVRMGSFLSVLRALGMLENAQVLVPEALVRPSQIAAKGSGRKRATSRRSRDRDPSGWVWGDEA